MSAICYTHPSLLLIRRQGSWHNHLTCPPATKLFRARLRITYGGSLGAHSPPHTAYAPDLAGLPAISPVSWSLHPHSSKRYRNFAVVSGRPSFLNVQRLRMASANASGEQHAPDREALAPPSGAAQPPLDLSLGHFGTTAEETTLEVDVQHIGPFRVVFNLRTATGAVSTDLSAFSNRAERRAAEREFLKVAARIGRETGLTISMGGKP
jgi:hypothetical protein